MARNVFRRGRHFLLFHAGVKWTRVIEQPRELGLKGALNTAVADGWNFGLEGTFFVLRII